MGVGTVTAASVALWYANNNTPERQQRWRNIPQEQRDAYWIVMTDETTFKLKKPPEAGFLFGSAAERLLDAFVNDNPDAGSHVIDSMGKMFLPHLTPTFADVYVGYKTNEDLAFGSQIVPDRMLGLVPEYQYQPYTTELSKWMGHTVGAFPGLRDSTFSSPIMIDYYVRSLTSSIGTNLWNAADYGLRKTGVLPDPIKPLSTLADIPIIKGFVIRYPTATAQSIQDFNEEYNAKKKTFDTIQYLAMRGDTDNALRELAIDPAALADMGDSVKAIWTLNGIVRMTWDNPGMSATDKKQLIDTMYGQMILIAEEGRKQMRVIDQALEKAGPRLRDTLSRGVPEMNEATP